MTTRSRRFHVQSSTADPWISKEPLTTYSHAQDVHTDSDFHRQGCNVFPICRSPTVHVIWTDLSQQLILVFMDASRFMALTFFCCGFNLQRLWWCTLLEPRVTSGSCWATRYTQNKQRAKQRAAQKTISPPAGQLCYVPTTSILYHDNSTVCVRWQCVWGLRHFFFWVKATILLSHYQNIGNCCCLM